MNDNKLVQHPILSLFRLVLLLI